MERSVSVELWAARIPFVGLFALHHWFVIHTQGRHDRWEVWQRAAVSGVYIGHLHKNLMPYDRGVGAGPGWIVEAWTGEEALALALRIETSPWRYPWCHRYWLLPGPNSNSYAQWILADRRRLSWRSWGARFGRAWTTTRAEHNVASFLNRNASPMLDQARNELAPTGVLRAGINLSNFLLVTGTADNGDPQGVSPDIAKAVADRLGVPVSYVPFKTPGELADAAADDTWDIGNIGAEPERARTITFTAAYVEIEATYLVPAGSPLQSIEEVDQSGIRIAVSARSAYDLWLTDNIRNAELVKANGIDASFELFQSQQLDALAGLRPRLVSDVEKLPGARILDGQFSAVQQAIGTKPDRPAGAAFLSAFVEEAKASGLVASFIEKHGVTGKLSVAPPA